jgi:SWIM zinc finger
LVQFKVKSSDPAKLPYMVDVRARTCTCPDHLKGHYCKHRVAAQVYRLACARMPSRIEPTPEPAQTQPCKAGQAIIWACLRLDGKNIGVEVVGIENEQVWVQALPILKEDGKLEPQFPFPNGSCSQKVKASDREHIHIYINA